MPKPMKNPLICALDTVDITAARRLRDAVAAHVGAFKIGLEFFTMHGAAGVEKVLSCDDALFLDLKFHDIPNTVAGAVRAAVQRLHPAILDVHAAGGTAMMRAAAEAAAETAARNRIPRPEMLAVTVLTSMDAAALQKTGIARPVAKQVGALGVLARHAGLDGVVCSGHEIGLLRQECGQDFRLLTPGIRPAGTAKGDQKRVMTPAAAITAGADYLVVGRPISEADDPEAAAAGIAAEIAATIAKEPATDDPEMAAAGIAAEIAATTAKAPAVA